MYKECNFPAIYLVSSHFLFSNEQAVGERIAGKRQSRPLKQQLWPCECKTKITSRQRTHALHGVKHKNLVKSSAQLRSSASSSICNHEILFSSTLFSIDSSTSSSFLPLVLQIICKRIRLQKRRCGNISCVITVSSTMAVCFFRLLNLYKVQKKVILN